MTNAAAMKVIRASFPKHIYRPLIPIYMIDSVKKLITFFKRRDIKGRPISYDSCPIAVWGNKVLPGHTVQVGGRIDKYGLEVNNGHQMYRLPLTTTMVSFIRMFDDGLICYELEISSLSKA